MKSPDIQSQFSSRFGYKLFIPALILLTLAVYLQTGTFSFTAFDDPAYVTENEMVRRGLGADGFFWAFTTVQGGAWMPVTWLSHMLDVTLFGLDGGSHHLVNVLFHIMNTVLLYLLLNRLTTRMWASFLVAALFALHPLHVESVAWIAERRDMLSTFWGLITIFVYVRWTEVQNRWRYLGLMLCFTISLGAKPMLVTLPAILCLLDLWPLKRLDPEALLSIRLRWKEVAASVLEKIPLLAVALFLSGVTVVAENKIGSLGTLDLYPLSFRVGNALLSYVRYIAMTFYPLDLVPYYPFPESINFAAAGGALLVLVLVSGFCVRHIRSKPYLIVGWLWFLITLLPVIGLIQQGSGFSMADRYTYVPLIGLFIMLVWGLSDLIAQLKPPAFAVWMIAAASFAIVTLISFQQVGRWRDNSTLFSYTLSVDPDNMVALSQLGVLARDSGSYAEALSHLRKAAELYPDNYKAQGNLAKLFWLTGKTSEALHFYGEAIRVNPDEAGAYTDIGIIRAEAGDFAGALATLTKAAQLDPENPEIRFNIAMVFYGTKRYDEAVREFSLIIAKNPGFATAYNGLGTVYLETGKLNEAAAAFRRALQLEPRMMIARENLETALGRLRKERTP